MDYIFVLLTLFLILPTIGAKCSNKNGVYRFGDSCGFMCHCKGNIECDVVTGECSSGCARGWYGPGCQYRDILENKLSKFSDTSYSPSVTDGDSKTCLRQVKSRSTKRQTWSVRLGSNETINEMQIVTTANSIASFKNFEVFVGYIPSTGSDDVVNKQTCFRQRVGIPKSRTFSVLCDKPVIGNYVNIDFAELQNELELCDVKINGGRNLAFSRSASQVLRADRCLNVFCYAKASVDGQTNTTIKWYCSYTRKMIKPWWKVDIGFQMKIWSVRILSYIDKNHENVPYVVHITKSKDSVVESLYSTHELLSDTQTVALNSMGRFVKISIDLEVEQKLAVCEVFVFGDCPANRCGYNCEKQCQCEHAPVWNKITGNCSMRCNKKDKGYLCDMPSKTDNDYSLACGDNCLGDECNSNSGKCIRGCKSGWDGPFCNKNCDEGYYGENCSKKCNGHCKNGYCNNVNGHCTYGCMDGWKTPLCDQACSSGRYGPSCAYTCSQRCDKQECNNTDGRCTSGCIPGWTGETCAKRCDEGYYGENCSKKCSGHCKDGHCNNVNGRCTYGCMDGWKTPLCDQACSSGMYGHRCTYKCSQQCDKQECNNTDGSCTSGCIPGWKGEKCGKTCPARKFGAGCNEDCTANCKNDVCDHVNCICRNGCKPGYRGNKCESECLAERYGEGCKENCSVNCKTRVCNHVNGNCSEGCNPGYRGNKCEEKCNNGYYGDKCANECNAHCKEGDRICRHTDGECLNGCQAGWNGKKCDSQCNNGFYGDKCTNECNTHCKEGDRICRHTDGECLNGCQAGWNGKKCDSKCLPGKFGIGCKKSCPSNCKHDTCGYVNGDCDEGCKLGFQGKKCKENCTSGTFGDNCSTKCSDYCEGGDKMCRPTDGNCLNGCKAGWNGTDCFSKCDNGFYGKHCALVCGNCLPGKGCNHVNGTCHGGCQTGYSGATCLQAMQTSSSIVAGGVAVLVILIVIVVIAFVWHKQRNQNKRKDEQRENVELRDAVATASNENRRPSHGGNTQSNTDDSGIPAAAVDANIYSNFPMQSPSRNAIPLSNLLSYVKENLANPYHFATEFQEIPYGMKKSSAVAKKSFNRGKNRYKDMHAYDETRVKLKKLPNIQGSDYINASFIKGHHKEYAYIAAQGPIDSSMDDFWRMIWEKDVYTIAMVTNLVELEKAKCQQYWPAVETSTRYGNAFVNTASEIIYYDFTIRNFNVSFEGEPQRNIRQFHFTSWPDKSVPKRPSSLIQFWRKVRKNDENKDNTWLVHCSAGVGRTGTFIALDILYDQGKDKGSIDVYQCVKDLRDQRVNMVQTKEQYVYLHGLMVEALLLFSEPVPLDNIHKIVRDLKTVDQATKKTKMLLQYEALNEDMTLLRPEKEVKEMYSAALLKENSSKNRSFTVLPPNDFRPILVTNIRGCTNYINAVLTPSYWHSPGCYVTQKPLENTTVDFCRLLYELNVKVIVKFPDNEKNHVEPDMTIGPFKLKKVSEEDKVFYTMTVFNMAHSSKTKKITQLEFKNWNTDQITPTDPENMLHFLQEVERLNRIAADSPLLVQCLDGSEKSGLFITLMNIFERVRLDKEVCIPQVIRELRYIRQQIIPNFEQFQFCYGAVLCYVDSHQMYANM